MARAEDERIGQLLKAIRRSAGMTQARLAALAGVPVRDIIDVETGCAGAVELERLRRLFRAAGGNARLTVWFNGAAADRLLDERNAGLAERGGAVFLRHAGQTTSRSRSRSSMSAARSISYRSTSRAPPRRCASSRARSARSKKTNRVLDVKERLARKIVAERFGWHPRSTGRLLIVPEDSTIRRIVAQHSLTMESIYPARGRAIRRWIKRPDGPLRGLWFLSERPR